MGGLVWYLGEGLSQGSALGRGRGNFLGSLGRRDESSESCQHFPADFVGEKRKEN